MKILLLLLLSFNAYAGEYMLKFDFTAPTEREHCIKGDSEGCAKYMPISLSEIKGYSLWFVDCDNPIPKGKPDVSMPAGQHSYWFQSDTSTACVVIQVIDTKERKSLFNKRMAVDFRAPKPPGCTL